MILWQHAPLYSGMENSMHIQWYMTILWPKSNGICFRPLAGRASKTCPTRRDWNVSCFQWVLPTRLLLYMPGSLLRVGEVVQFRAWAGLVSWPLIVHINRSVNGGLGCTEQLSQNASKCYRMIGVLHCGWSRIERQPSDQSLWRSFFGEAT